MLLYLLAVPLIQSLLLVCLRLAVVIRASQAFLEQMNGLPHIWKGNLLV
jgi:hypothetical protein